uniref:Uncharacterized protein n=1 Tax=Arundo donax TaxID=35708 RepID=A0A0A9HID2_ARUDO
MARQEFVWSGLVHVRTRALVEGGREQELMLFSTNCYVHLFLVMLLSINQHLELYL